MINAHKFFLSDGVLIRVHGSRPGRVEVFHPSLGWRDYQDYDEFLHEGKQQISPHQASYITNGNPNIATIAIDQFSTAGEQEILGNSRAIDKLTANAQRAGVEISKMAQRRILGVLKKKMVCRP